MKNLPILQHVHTDHNLVQTAVRLPGNSPRTVSVCLGGTVYRRSRVALGSNTAISSAPAIHYR